MKDDWKKAVLLRVVLVVVAVILYVLLKLLAEHGITGKPNPVKSTYQPPLSTEESL